MFFVIEDDELMAECIRRAILKARLGAEVWVFSNGLLAMEALNEVLPEMIFMDVLLDGPDGFTFLNELASYEDTAKIPVVVVSSLDLTRADLSNYGVVKVIHKDTMRPEDIMETIR